MKRDNLYMLEDGIKQMQKILDKYGNIPVFVNGEYGSEQMMIPIDGNFSVGSARFELGDDFEYVTTSIKEVLDPEENVLSIGGW